MQELANNLISLARGTERRSAVVSGDDAARIRFGVWPFISAQTPEVANGIMVVLAGLLEQWPDALVYRLPVRAEAQAETLPLESLSSQFSVDDWEVDYLDENVAVWGELTQGAAGWHLEVSFENDLSDADVETLAVDATSLAQLVARLPQVAAEIADKVSAGYPGLLSAAYVGPDASGDDALSQFLAALFRWERQLFVALWRGEEAVDWAAQLDDLLRHGGAVDTDFAGWAVADALSRLLQAVSSELIEAKLTDPWDVVLEALPQSAALMLMAARMAKTEEDDQQRRVDLLEPALERSPEDGRLRLALADAYRVAGRPMDMIALLQGGFDYLPATAELYFYYAQIIVALHRSNVVIRQFALVDVEDRQLSRMLEEACASFERGLALKPERVDMLAQQATLQLELSDDAFWPIFAELVSRDDTGAYIRAVVDGCAVLEDTDPGLDLIADAVEREPERVDLRVSYAALLLLSDLNDDAIEELEAAAGMTDDTTVVADIERLLLQARDPEFEMRLGDISALLAASKPLGKRDIDFLENALEQAPSFTQGYLMLARAYRQQEAHADALEVLLDGQSAMSENAEITAELAQVLWALEQHDLAFDYLNKGLAANPDDVPLLALTGRYLFVEGQDEEARTFLSRAQSLEPRNTMLRETQRYISTRYH